jgi:deferrochelatase/peroxidase EfeB
VPFHGVHQAGILPSPQRQTIVLAFDVTAGNRSELKNLLQTLTTRSRFLTSGGTPVPAGATGPPSDSGILGPGVVPDGLTSPSAWALPCSTGGSASAPVSPTCSPLWSRSPTMTSITLSAVAI